ncbi:unnamed protein product [Penicillium nalgiovense]|uniref:Protein kinase domain-containing protein n=1 Tax=Penicillium nalgiovense TaxID=60175 RepID=A0A1V6Y867_PENNA|nr:hypothetical protein PENNAL_c0032G11604 [Penicillium nalgiovense]CAG7966464.1 unnamed protein product [Penicillium nalgiovense]CAG7980823.1 unnamed protein product [Penicillium nalgiovense]CAG7981290.1 unnamed protein product [Penicillium nalgiovense]CAG7981635.1 unnamed protein product [Penicillium nalgiovense]
MPETEHRPVLPKMIGEKIITHASDDYPRRKWIIREKLSENPFPLTEEDVKQEMGPAFTVGKYLCEHDGAKDKLAFLRIFKQIPWEGTELDDSHTRAKQAVDQEPGHVELAALKYLTENGCSATPKLLGYEFDNQDKNDLVPGGYILYLVWEKVKGDPLDFQEFWRLPYKERESIREKFRETYTKILTFGYEPMMPSASKIILDKATGDVKISGFGNAAYIGQSGKWNDRNFLRFSLALQSLDRCKYIPDAAKDLRHSSNGWIW